MILSSTPGAHLSGIATAMPDNRVDQGTVAQALKEIFQDEDPDFIDSLVERSGVETRYTVPTVDQVLTRTTFTERNDFYRRAAAALSLRAASAALEDAKVSPESIDVIIDVSCTGISIPALDVTLAPQLGLRPDVRRIPITESGCAAGALALGMAATFAQSGLNVLVIAVEACTLTLVREDLSRTNLIASLLFGDGAGAMVITSGGSGPRLEATSSYLVPDSHAAMGFDVGEHGLRIRLQRELPVILRRNLPSSIDNFLEQHGRTRDDIGLHLVHPGGRKILEAYEGLFELGSGNLKHSREALRRFGNLSSVSILTVLQLALGDELDQGFNELDGRDALLVGVGPGLSLEFSLLSMPQREGR